MDTVIQDIAEPPQLHYRFTVDAYHRMIEDGTLEEGAPFELLDGQVVRKIRSAAGEDPTTISPRHFQAVTRIADLNGKLKKSGCHMRSQGPTSLPPFDEPEPDGAIAIGTREDYDDRHPTAHDLLCVIEVSDASLRTDRGHKQRVYANSGIATYVIVNLQDDGVEVYTEPLIGKGRYGQSVTLTPRETLALPTAKGKPVQVKVKQLLP
jgi:Uma2 family endonuclease